MTEQRASTWLIISALIAAPLALCAAAQEYESQASSTVGPAASATNSAATGPQILPPPKLEKRVKPPASDGVQDVLKMMAAGVSKEVIKAYVENARITVNPNGADMIALKEHGVPDDIAIALLKRGSEHRQPHSPAPAPAYPVDTGSRLYPDPESYDYFQYYYLYPRTLASAYERLGFYPGPYFPGYPGFRGGVRP